MIWNAPLGALYAVTTGDKDKQTQRGVLVVYAVLSRFCRGSVAVLSRPYAKFMRETLAFKIWKPDFSGND